MYYYIDEIIKLLCQKNISPPPTAPHDCKKINIHHRKNNLQGNYEEFNFRMGTVLVIPSFLWMDNDILALEEKCLLMYHIPAICIPVSTLRRVVKNYLYVFLKLSDLVPNIIKVINLYFKKWNFWCFLVIHPR